MRFLILLSFFISLLVFVVSLFVFNFYNAPLEESSFQATATVTPDLGGFDLNSSALTFGSIALGGSSTRSILVDNSYPFPIKVYPKVDGSISKILSYDPIIVNSNESSRIYLTVYADDEELLGNYSGNVSIRLMRA